MKEKRKKEEEKLEAERKKQKAASNFASFFVASKKQGVNKSTAEEVSAAIETNFMPFEVKADMRVAPVNRRTITAEEKLYLDQHFNIRSLSHKLLYLENMRHGRHVPKKSRKTWPLEAKDDEIVLLGKKNRVSGFCFFFQRNYNRDTVCVQTRTTTAPPIIAS